ncbi:hypothetical protein ES703_101648 [subsurface metagenome]
MFVLENSTGKKLSGFYPNAGSIQYMLAYRKGDWYSYDTKEEAERHLAYIRNHGTGKQLRVVERG